MTNCTPACHTSVRCTGVIFVLFPSPSFKLIENDLDVLSTKVHIDFLISHFVDGLYSRVIVLALHSASLKLLAQLLPQLHSGTSLIQPSLGYQNLAVFVYNRVAMLMMLFSCMFL